ncbi:hypothetical protein Tco_0021708, partial [Tanacetum coccineum]
TARAGETGLSTRGGSRRQKRKSGSCTELHRSHLLSQLIELNVNSFHDSSGYQRAPKTLKKPQQEYGSVFRQRRSAVESSELSFGEKCRHVHNI